MIRARKFTISILRRFSLLRQRFKQRAKTILHYIFKSFIDEIFVLIYNKLNYIDFYKIYD